MFNKINQTETKTLLQIEENKQKHSDVSLQGLHSDISISHKKAKLEVELEKIRRIKKEIMENIQQLRIRKENTLLSVDKIMFDNTVMFDCMMKNFSRLNNLCN